METQGNTQTQSRQWLDLKAKFDALCDEQEKLYNTKFEAVFEALFEIDNEQREIYNTKFWNMGCKLPDKADEGKIRQALKQAGFDGDKDFCKCFLRYANGVIEGKKIQQLMAIQNYEELPKPKADKQPINVKGWKFKPITIIAPVMLQDIIIQAVFDSANKTDIQAESIDEMLDELANREDFHVRGCMTRYIEELRNYKVISDKGSFLDMEKTRYLFCALKIATDSMKANTNKPETVKAEIADIIRGFDAEPVWGLFFQILTLQGLCGLFERLDINETDTGYYEAQSVYDWLCNLLIKKETFFCCLPYGDNDMKLLEPFCAYLMSTEIGRFVQAGLFGSDEQPADEQSQQETQHTYNAQQIPEQLNTDKAKQYFEKAIELELMDNCFRWKKGLQMLSCFAREMSLKLDLNKASNSDGTKRISWKPFEELFGIEHGKLRLNYNDIQKTGQNPSESNLIDKVFE